MTNHERSLPYKIETDSKTYERQKRSERSRALGAVALTTIALGGTLAGYLIFGGSNKVNAEPVVTNPIESVSIEKGARIRMDASVSDSEHGENNILYVTDHALEVTATDNNIKSVDDSANGEWYKIPVKDIKDPEVSKAVERDPDGVVYVNSQKSTSHRVTDTMPVE